MKSWRYSALAVAVMATGHAFGHNTTRLAAIRNIQPACQLRVVFKPQPDIM